MQTPFVGGASWKLSGLRKGTDGGSTNGVTANDLFFDRDTFWYSH